MRRWLLTLILTSEHAVEPTFLLGNYRPGNKQMFMPFLRLHHDLSDLWTTSPTWSRPPDSLSYSSVSHNLRIDGSTHLPVGEARDQGQARETTVKSTRHTVLVPLGAESERSNLESRS